MSNKNQTAICPIASVVPGRCSGRVRNPDNPDCNICPYYGAGGYLAKLERKRADAKKQAVNQT